MILLVRNFPVIRAEHQGAVDDMCAQPLSPLPAHLLDVPGRDVDVPPPVFSIVYEAVPPIEQLHVMRWYILLINVRTLDVYLNTNFAQEWHELGSGNRAVRFAVGER